MRPRRWGIRGQRETSSRVSSTARALEPYPYDPTKARQRLAEAGYADGFDAGDFAVDNVFTGIGEAMVNDLAAVRIRTKMRPLNRAADQAAHHARTHKGL